MLSEQELQAEIEARLPPWRPIRAETTVDGAHEGIIMHGQQESRLFAATVREITKVPGGFIFALKDGKPKVPVRHDFDMPASYYVRAVDPSGNLCTLVVATAHNMNDGDVANVADSILVRKRRQGFLLAEPGEGAPPGRELYEFLWSQIFERKAKHAIKENRDSETTRSRIEATQEAQGARMIAAIEAQTSALTGRNLDPPQFDTSEFEAAVDAKVAEKMSELEARMEAKFAELAGKRNR